jgi:hypothetical protein
MQSEYASQQSPHRIYHDGVDVHVNVECGDCYVSVVVEVEKKNSTEWVGSEGASVDGEEW